MTTPATDTTKIDDKEKVKELPQKEKVEETPTPAPKVETRVARLAGMIQSEIKTLADRVGALEGKTPTDNLEDEITREERVEEQENLFDEVGRRCAEILGVDA